MRPSGDRAHLLRQAALTAAAFAALTLVASRAQAAPFVDVTYDLGDSSGISTVTLPAAGDLTVDLTPDNFSGRQTIRYQSDSGSNIVGGPVSLISFNLTVNAPVSSTTRTLNDPDRLQLATSTLYLKILNLPQGGGSLIGSVLDPQGAVATFSVTGQQHCLALCFALGPGVVRSVPGPFAPITFMQTLPVLHTSTATGDHVVTGTTTASFTLDPGDPSTKTTELVPVVAQTFLVGREVSRTGVVPEPGTLFLLGAGTAGLALVSRATRRSRQR